MKKSKIDLARGYKIARDGITQSLFEKYMACPAKFAIATGGLSSPAKAVMELGNQGHLSLEKGEVSFDFDPKTPKADQELIRAAIEAVVPAYFKYYKTQDRVFKRDPEKVFDVPFAGVRLRGKIDDILTKKNETWLFETKFKSRIDEDNLERRLSLDWQGNFYALAFSLFSAKRRFPDGLIYNVVRYPKLAGSPRELYEKTVADVAERPEHWFKRWQVEFDADELELFRDELLEKILEATSRKVWYKNQCACTTGYGLCQYIDFCATGSKTGLVKRPLFSELAE